MASKRESFRIVTLILLVVIGAGAGFRHMQAGTFGNTIHDYWMYVGTDTSRGRGEGIYAFRFHPETGKVEPAGLAAGRFWDANADASRISIPRIFSQIRAGWPNPRVIARGVQVPVFLVTRPDGRYLYAADKLADYTVTAFRIDPSTGKLTILNSSSSVGNGALTIDSGGEHLLFSDYSTGKIAVLPIRSDGSLGKAECIIALPFSGANPAARPHPHSMNLSPDNRFAVAADLALDRIYVYRFDSRTGKLAPNDPPFVKTPAGAGARHLTFDPKGRFAWLIEEQGSSILSLRWDAAKGVFLPLSSVRTTPQDFHGVNAAAEIQLHPGGKFLYASNRGHDSIVVFAIDESTGALAPVEYVPARGSRPLSFAIDPSGRYLFVNNVATQDVIEFRIDPLSGRLAVTGTVLPVPDPVSVTFAPAR
jgi:6-phosphogluconolactonase